MNRRAFIAALFAPFVGKLQRVLPKRELSFAEVEARTSAAIELMAESLETDIYGGVFIQSPFTYGDNRPWT